MNEISKTKNTSDFLDKKNEISPIKNSILLSSQPIYCCQLDGKGNATQINQDGEATIKQPCWLHLDFKKKKQLIGSIK